VKKGYKIGDQTFKVHLDGLNLLPFLSGKEDKSPRDAFIYWSDDGDCMAVRTGHYKVVFAEQRSEGINVWRDPLSTMRIPKFFDLRADPFERGEESIKYNEWFLEQNFLMYAVPPMLGKWLESFKEFPPRAKSASFSIDQVVETLMPKAG
jgi:arylsulfatase